MPSPPLLTEYDYPVLMIARRLSLLAESNQRLKGRWTMKCLSTTVLEELKIKLPRSPKDGPVGRLIAAGAIVQYPAKERIVGDEHGNGTRNVYRTPSVERVTLGTLMTLARENIDPNLKGQRGRRGHSAEARHVMRISAAQYTKIRTMARHVSQFVAPGAELEEEAYEAVGGAYLMWDPAEGLDGDWRPFFELIDRARPPAGRRADDRSAARTLLDLAATHAVLLRAARSEAYVIPTTWAEVQGRWTRAAEHPGISAVLAVNYWLGTIADVLGPEVDPEALDLEQVERVVAYVEDCLLTDRSLSTGHKQSIRRSMRRIMDAGLVPVCDLNSWDYRQRHRAAAWSSTITKAIAATVASGKRGKGLDVAPDGYAAWKEFPFPVLADPKQPYSLARALDFHSAKGHERERLGMRGLGDFPREAARGASSLTRQYWGEATVRMRLGQLAIYVGWIQRHHPQIDLQAASLADLLTEDLLDGYATAVDAEDWSTLDSGMRVLITIGLIASPCLEAEALRAGNVDLADQFFRVSCLATGRGRWDKEAQRYNGRNLYKIMGEGSGDDDETSDDSIENARAQAEAIEAAYTRVLDVATAHEGMERVYRAARAYVLEILGVESMTELGERWGALDVRPKELEYLRALATWNLSLAAPMRTKTQVQLTTNMIVERRGRIDVKVPAKIFKMTDNGDYSVMLWSADGSGFDASLMRLYLMPGGIRERLLNPDGVQRRSAPWLWVNSFARGNTQRPQVLEATLNSGCKTVIMLAARSLGLSSDDVAALEGVAQVHSFRHAIAGRLVQLARIEDARVLLHHAKYDMILKVYAARNPDVTIGDLRTSDPRSEADVSAILDGLSEEQRAELLRLLQGDAVA